MTTVTLEDVRNATPGEPLRTNDAVLTIQMPEERLPLGEHVFELSVTDTSGNVSRTPARISVFVIDTEAPTPILEVRDEQGRLLDNNTIPFGTTFTLDARRSTDVGGGTIASYEWRLVEQ